MSENLHLDNLVVISGIRPFGRTISQYKNGRPYHGLLYIWSGEATFFLPFGKSLKVTAGELLYIPQSLKYKMQYTAPSTTFVVVNFNLSKEDGSPFPLADSLLVLARDKTTYAIADIMSKLEICSASQNIAGQFRRKELLYRLLTMIYSDREIYTNQNLFPQIAEGVILLKQSYLENLPIEEFAKKSNVSISSFRSLFHKQYGMSPLQYRNMLRINRASELLEYDNCTVAEAAYASGFENIGYFCRCYKKFKGKTPGQARHK